MNHHTFNLFNGLAHMNLNHKQKMIENIFLPSFYTQFYFKCIYVFNNLARMNHARLWVLKQNFIFLKPYFALFSSITPTHKT